MNKMIMLWSTMLLASCALIASGPSPARAQAATMTTFVHLANNVPAVLYAPADTTPKSKIALLVMHGADYLSFSACTELSARGYLVLCANPSSSNLDRTLLEVKLGVEYLRRRREVTKVVLFGHSGGATVMSAYQNIAENGTAICQDSRKIHRCPNSLVGLPPADALILADANWGNAEMMLFSVDPAVVDETDGSIVDPALDMFNPVNGFNPTGSTFDKPFASRFLKAEAARYNRLVELALARDAALRAGHGRYADDEPFEAAGANSAGPDNKLFTSDTRFLSRSQRPWPLLHRDGTVTTEIVHSVRRPENTESKTNDFALGSLRTTVNDFLASQAIRVDDDFGYNETSIWGIEWTSSYASPPGNVEGVTVPLLAMGMTGHWEGLAAETIYTHAKSSDKRIAFVEGALHGYATCKACERTAGQYGDTMKTTYDFIDKWLSEGRLGGPAL